MLRRLLSMCLAVCLVMGLALPAFAQDTKLTVTKVDNNSVTAQFGDREAVEIEDEKPAYADKDMVRVSIILEKAGAIEAGYSVDGIGKNNSAINYQNNLKKDQDKLVDKIAKAAGEIEVVWNLTLAANLISANVRYGQIAEIEKVAGVKAVVIETRYEPDVASTGAADPNMATSGEQTGSNLAWNAGYTGAGSRVAIIDTGLDTAHEAFDADAFLYSLDVLAARKGLTVDAYAAQLDLLDAEEIAAVLPQLNAAEWYDGLTAEDLYENAKVPFGFSYIDKELDETHTGAGSEHGSHVAGIAAANAYVENANGGFDPALTTTYVQGVAPDAQLLVMKVFGKAGGAYDSDYMAAIEDAIRLEADSVNLSLGSGNPGMSRSSTAAYQAIMESLEGCGVVVTMSAGNSGAWMDAAEHGIPYLYLDDVSMQTDGSPGSYTNSFTIASVDNAGFTVPGYIGVNNAMVTFAETSYTNAPIATIAGDHEYVFVNAIGTPEQFAAVNEVVSLEGKIVLCYRGETSFFEKANAAAELGAAAVVIVNNQDGIINMDLTGYTYTAPVVSILQADGEHFKAAGTQATTEDGTIYWTGSASIVTETVAGSYNNEYNTMSSFSSWGVPGSLELKPEVTAPGGNIYSVAGAYDNNFSDHASYEVMSGTSMAAPQVAGMAALVAQYIREQGLEDKTDLDARTLAQSLLMSTAVPAMEEESGNYYSVMKQGAGIANVGLAVSANSYILMDKDATASYADGKVKAELGDDPAKTGVYTFSFYINNLTDEAQRYELGGSFFTQDAFSGGSALFLDTWTTPLYPTLKWTVDGKAVNATAEEVAELDFNGDGKVDANDGQTLLDYATGVITEVADDGPRTAAPAADMLYKAYLADLNEDGEINSYDAYLFFDKLNKAGAVVPANGSAKVTVTATLSNDDREWLANYENGAYVEGYVFAAQLATEEGVEGTVHSIPMLGFYGNWSDASMYDKGSYIAYALSGEENRPPYLYTTNFRTGRYNGLLVEYNDAEGMYWFGGNPFFEEEYMPERDAFSGVNGDKLSKMGVALIRNAAQTKFGIWHTPTGTPLVEAPLGEINSAYYYVNGATWKDTFRQINLGMTLAGLPDGLPITVGLVAAPEYYVDAEGNTDWDALGDGAYLTVNMTVDNTAPEVLSASVNASDSALNVQVKDNQYIAAVFLFDALGQEVLAEAGSNAKQAAGDTVDYALDLTGVNGASFLLQVYDYANNVTTYKLEQQIGEVVDTIESVSVNPTSVTMLNGSSVQLTASVAPSNAANRSVVWTSSDEAVVTVDEYGKLTAVGLGEATITVTSAADETKSATCAVEVFEINTDLNAVVWDEEGEVWYSEFNTADLPNYTKLTETSWDAPIGALAMDQFGDVYAASLNDDNTSTLYKVNNDTFALEEIGTDEIFYADLAMAPSLGDNYLMTVYGPYLTIVDASTGSYLGVFEYTSELVGVTYAGTMYMSNYSQYADVYYLLDADGNFYQQIIMPYGTGYARFYDTTPVANLGMSTEFLVYQSMFYDFDTDLLFISNFASEADNCVVLYAVDLNTGSIYKVGQFADGVWPVAGLDKTTTGPEPAAFGEELADAVLDEANLAKTEITEFVSFSNAVKGGLNAIAETETSDLQSSGAKTESMTVKVTAKDENGVDVDSTNGVVTVTFDADKLELLKVRNNADYISVNDVDVENGVVTIGYVAMEGITAGDAVATLIFDVKDSDLETMTVVHEEVGAETPDYEETVLLVAPATIISQTADVEVAIGKAATITIEAEGKDLTYTWYFKNPNGTKFKATDTFTGNTYNVRMTEARNGRQVYCVVTDKFGNSVQSDIYTLTLKPTVAAIVTQPLDVVVDAGERATVTVVAEGDGLTYEWYYKNVGATSFVKTEVFSGSRYSVVMNAARDGRQLYCVITDKYGNSVTTDTVTIAMQKSSNLAIVIQPEDVTVAEGESAVVAFTAVGEGLTYEWYFRNAGSSKFVKTDSFVDCRYSVVMNAARDGRQVYCVVTDMYGNTVQTDVVTISMK